MICRYLARYPGVSIDLEIGDRGIDLLGDGFDLAIVTGHVDTPDFVARRLWQSTRKLLLASPRCVEARGAPRRLEDLARHAGIATHESDGIATWTLIHASRRRRVRFAPRLYVSEFSAAHRATVSGLGIALLPEVLCSEDLAHRRLVRILDGHEGEAGGVSLLYRAHRALTAAVRICVEHFLAELPASDPIRRAGPEAERIIAPSGRRAQPGAAAR